MHNLNKRHSGHDATSPSWEYGAWVWLALCRRMIARDFVRTSKGFANSMCSPFNG